MPIYEYICLKCEDRFERLTGVSSAEPSCPSCGENRVRKQFSVFASPSPTPSATTVRSGGGACGAGGGCCGGGACGN